MLPSQQPWSTLSGTLLLMSACFGAPADTTSATVRFWTLNDATRVVIETTGEFSFTSDRAYTPDRIFFDVKGARLRVGSSRGQHTVAVGDRLLKQIRIAETQPGVTRVVFDLDGAADFTASQLTNPSRLIVELRPGISNPPPATAVGIGPQSSVPAAPVPPTSENVTPPSLPAAVAKLPPPPAVAKKPEKVQNVKPPL